MSIIMANLINIPTGRMSQELPFAPTSHKGPWFVDAMRYTGVGLCKAEFQAKGRIIFCAPRRKGSLDVPVSNVFVVVVLNHLVRSAKTKLEEVMRFEYLSCNLNIFNI